MTDREPRLTKAQWVALLDNPHVGDQLSHVAWRVTERLEHLGLADYGRVTVQGAMMVSSLLARMDNGYVPPLSVREAMLDCYSRYALRLLHDPAPRIRMRAVSWLTNDQITVQTAETIAHDPDAHVRDAGARILLRDHPEWCAYWNGETDPLPVSILVEYADWRAMNPLTSQTPQQIVQAWAENANQLNNQEFDRLLNLHKADDLILLNAFTRLDDTQRVSILNHAIQVNDTTTIDIFVRRTLDQQGHLTMREYQLVHAHSPYWQKRYENLMTKIRQLTGGITPQLPTGE